MTSANGGTNAGQYPCHGKVDNLEPTLFITTIDFLIQGHNLKETMNYLVERKNICFALRMELNFSFSEFREAK